MRRITPGRSTKFLSCIQMCATAPWCRLMKAKPRTLKQDRLARIYDQEVLPIWSQRFGRMMLRDLALPPRANILDVACGTGYPSLEILRKLDDQGRIIAIDPSAP